MYEQQVLTTPDLLFFEERDVSGLFSTQEFLEHPERYRVMLKKFITRIPDAPAPPASARKSGAWAFNEKGVLTQYPSLTARPNYVFENNAWTQSGYLSESSAVNYTYDQNDLGPIAYFPNSYLTNSDNVAPAPIQNVPNDSILMRGSIYIVTSDPRTTADKVDFWWSGSGGDGTYLDITKRSLSSGWERSHWNPKLQDLGHSLRLSFAGGPPHSTMWCMRIIPRNGFIVTACPMHEVEASYAPTSWVSYGSVRAAD